MRSKMTSMILSVSLLTALAAWCLVPSRVVAQAKPAAQTKPASKPAPGRPPMGGERPPREVTMTGRVVSVHSSMTGQFASPDQTKSTADNIRAGVPAALDTPTGLILLGQGTTGVGRTLIPLAFQEVEVKGKLYEKGGLKYIDIVSVDAVAADEEDEEDNKDDGE